MLFEVRDFKHQNLGSFGSGCGDLELRVWRLVVGFRFWQARIVAVAVAAACVFGRFGLCLWDGDGFWALGVGQ